MSNPIRRRFLAQAPLICIALLSATITLLTDGPAFASAPHSSSGGSGITGGSGTSGSDPTTPGTSTQVLNLGTTVEATGDGITVSTVQSGLQGRTITFSGSVSPGDAGYAVVIRYTTAAHPNSWTQATTATPDTAGQFTATWTAHVSGRLSFTAALLASATATSQDSGGGGTTFGAPISTTTSETPAGATSLSTSAFTVTIFKSAIATFYGPGLWGHRTACGERLRKSTLGVASRTLKCGTEVAVYYRGHEIVVPVIDRGPFANHASWDLTEATAEALGITQTVTIGTLLQSATQ